MLIAIDGNNITCRDRFGAGRDKIAGLTQRRVEALRRKFRPSRVVACFDEGKSFRHSLFPEYKSGRDPIEGIEWDLQVSKTAYFCQGVDVASCNGCEADDVIATLSREYEGKVIVFSGDKDLHQLIEPGRVLQMVSAKSVNGVLEPSWVNSQVIIEKYGVSPAQWLDYRTLIGDKSDSIPGAAGIGPTSAETLLHECGTLEEFYRSPDKCSLTQTYKKRLFEFQDQWRTVRDLMTLVDDCNYSIEGEKVEQQK